MQAWCGAARCSAGGAQWRGARAWLLLRHVVLYGVASCAVAFMPRARNANVMKITMAGAAMRAPRSALC